jgi:histidine decarboxylase
MNDKIMRGDTTRQRLDALQERLDQDLHRSMGYPVAFDFDYAELFQFLGYSLNNVGDPFSTMTYRLNTHDFEREVLGYFAQLARAPKDEWWGYVTNGSTEGNLYGLYLARELHPDCIVYFSQDSHYSVAKNLNFLGMRNIMIRAQPSGEIDYADLEETIRIRRDATPVIFANIGTTMKEGRDDLATIYTIFERLALEKHYIHCDAALCGGYAAYLEPRPSWDFADGADSISISGHKFIGAPIPCGVALAKKANVDRIAHAIAYIGGRDTTISGSRNGFTPLMMWYALRKLGKAGLKRRLQHCLETASYAEKEFKKAGIIAWRNANAITVVFARPASEIISKWQLATQGDSSHIICMPHITREQVDALITEICASKAQEAAHA